MEKYQDFNVCTGTGGGGPIRIDLPSVGYELHRDDASTVWSLSHRHDQMQVFLILGWLYFRFQVRQRDHIEYLSHQYQLQYHPSTVTSFMILKYSRCSVFLILTDVIST